jgi:hypothetical protein
VKKFNLKIIRVCLFDDLKRNKKNTSNNDGIRNLSGITRTVNCDLVLSSCPGKYFRFGNKLFCENISFPIGFFSRFLSQKSYIVKIICSVK